MSMPVNWSDLPADLLVSVLERTKPCPIDLIGFASVCRSWRSAASFIVLPKRLPLLLTHTLNSNLPEPYFEHLNPLCGRTHRAPLPASPTASYCCLGSSQGWICLIDTHQWIRMILMNPISGTVIVLPPLRYFYTSGNDVPKFCLSSPDPERDPNCILLLTPNFLYTRPAVRDSEWRFMDRMCGYCYDIAAYDGVFYALGSRGVARIMVDDDDRYSPAGMKRLKTVSVAHPCLDEEVNLGRTETEIRLVVLPPGRLIMVRRRRIHGLAVDIRGKDLERGSDWEKVTSLGDWTLFFGCNSAVALSASEVEGGVYERNAIYFAYCLSLGCSHCDSHSLSVYSLQAQAMRRIQPVDFEHAALWIQPNFIKA